MNLAVCNTHLGRSGTIKIDRIIASQIAHQLCAIQNRNAFTYNHEEGAVAFMTKKSSCVIIRKGTGEMTRVIVTGGVLRIVFVIDKRFLDQLAGIDILGVRVVAAIDRVDMMLAGIL